MCVQGDVGKHRLEHYSRGVRQRLYKMAIDNDWKGKYNVQVGVLMVVVCCNMQLRW